MAEERLTASLALDINAFVASLQTAQQALQSFSQGIQQQVRDASGVFQQFVQTSTQTQAQVVAAVREMGASVVDVQRQTNDTQLEDLRQTHRLILDDFRTLGREETATVRDAMANMVQEIRYGNAEALQQYQQTAQAIRDVYAQMRQDEIAAARMTLEDTNVTGRERLEAVRQLNRLLLEENHAANAQRLQDIQAQQRAEVEAQEVAARTAQQAINQAYKEEVAALRQRGDDERGIYTLLKGFEKELADERKAALAQEAELEKGFAQLLRQLTQQETADRAQANRDAAAQRRQAQLQEAAEQRAWNQEIQAIARDLRLGAQREQALRLQAQRDANAQERELAQQQNAFLTQMFSVAAGLGLYTTFVQLIYGLRQLVTASVEAAARMEDMHVAFTTLKGSGNAANEILAHLFATSQHLGLEFERTAEGFKEFVAASKSSTLSASDAEKVFDNVSAGMRAMGLSGTQAQRVFETMAIVMSRGTVTARELHQRLAYELPGATQLVAQALGLTSQELERLVKTGLPAELFVSALSDAMEKLANASNVQQLERLSTTFAQLKNETLAWMTAIGEGIESKLKPWLDYLVQISAKVREIFDIKPPGQGSSSSTTTPTGLNPQDTATFQTLQQQLALAQSRLELATRGVASTGGQKMQLLGQMFPGLQPALQYINPFPFFDPVQAKADLDKAQKAYQDFLALIQLRTSLTTGQVAQGWKMAHSAFDDLVTEMAQAKGLSPALVSQVIKAESNFQANVTSFAGAQGLMQVMPGTATQYGYAGANLFDPKTNIKVGTTILADLMQRYNQYPDQMQTALAAYHAGPGGPPGVGGVADAIRKAQSQSYAEYSQYLPVATQRYVAGITQQLTGGGQSLTLQQLDATIQRLLQEVPKIGEEITAIDKAGLATPDVLKQTYQERLKVALDDYNKALSSAIILRGQLTEKQRDELALAGQQVQTLKNQVEQLTNGDAFAKQTLQGLKEREAEEQKILDIERQMLEKTLQGQKAPLPQDAISIQRTIEDFQRAQETGKLRVAPGGNAVELTELQLAGVKQLLAELEVAKQKALGEVPDSVRRELDNITLASERTMHALDHLTFDPTTMVRPLESVKTALTDLHTQMQDLAKDPERTALIAPEELQTAFDALGDTLETVQQKLTSALEKGKTLTPELREQITSLNTDFETTRQTLADVAEDPASFIFMLPTIIRNVAELATQMEKVETAAKREKTAIDEINKGFSEHTNNQVDDAIQKIIDKYAKLRDILGDEAFTAHGGFAAQQQEIAAVVAKHWDETAKGIQSSLANAFTSILNGQKNLLDALRDMFIKFLANLAAEAITHAIIIPALIQVFGSGGSSGSVGGLAASIAGVGGGAGLGSADTGGGGSGISSAVQGIGYANNAAKLLGYDSSKSISGIFGDIGSTSLGYLGIGTSAADYLTATGAYTAEDLSLMTSAEIGQEAASLGYGAGAGEALGATTLGTIGTGAAVGIGVGMLASSLFSMLGLHGTGNNVLSGAIGGAVGGTIVLPGIGTAIGAIVGAIGGYIASLFGSKRQPPKIDIAGVSPGMAGILATLQHPEGELQVTQPFAIGNAPFTNVSDIGINTMAQYQDVLGKLSEGVTSIFSQAVSQFSGLPLRMQKALVDPLNTIAQQMAQAVEKTKFEGDTIKEDMDRFFGTELPKQVEEWIKPLREGVIKIAPIVKQFNDTIASAGQILVQLTNQQAQVRLSLQQQIHGLQEGLMTPAEVYVRRQGELQNATAALASASPSQKLALIPVIQGIVNDLFSLGKQNEVLGQDPGLLRDLQSGLIEQLKTLQDVSDTVFEGAKGTVQEQITLAQQQVDILSDSLHNLSSIDNTITDSQAVLQQIQNALSPFTQEGQASATTQAQLALAAGSWDSLKSIDATATQQLEKLQIIADHIAGIAGGNTSLGSDSAQIGRAYIPTNAWYYLHAGEAVIPAHRVNQHSSSVVININGGAGSNPDDIADQVIRQIERRGARLQNTRIAVARR